ncbi:MAG: potassium channel family protein [Dehalococcoidia bacterium]
MKKQVVVVGLGRFGTSVAKELYQMGHDVLAIDPDENKVQELMGQVTFAVKADATSETVLRELGVPNFDVAIVGVGSDVTASILTTVLLKNLGIPFIIARARNPLHGDTLERIGADAVVYPEQEMGLRAAHVLFNPDVLDYMELAPAFGISKIRPPEQLYHLTLEEAELGGPRDKYGIAVLAITRGREHILSPSKDEVIHPGDILVVAGKSEMLVRLHGEAQELAKKGELGGNHARRTPRPAS